MSQLEDHRRTVANKVDGTTEDFVERLHSLDHNKQKRMLDGTVRQGETWFKDAQGQEECKATNTNNHSTDSKQPAGSTSRIDNTSASTTTARSTKEDHRKAVRETR